MAAPEETGPDVAIGHADRLTQVSIDCNSFLDIPIAVRLVCRQQPIETLIGAPDPPPIAVPPRSASARFRERLAG